MNYFEKNVQLLQNFPSKLPVQIIMEISKNQANMANITPPFPTASGKQGSFSFKADLKSGII